MPAGQCLFGRGACCDNVRTNMLLVAKHGQGVGLGKADLTTPMRRLCRM